MNASVEKLLRRTQRKLFFSSWFTGTLRFYFYAFFLGTALILTDRIAADLGWWHPYTMEYLILIYVAVTLVAGLIVGGITAWLNRRSMKELAWLIDRTCETDALLITALTSEDVRVDDEWRATIERKADELSRPLWNRPLVRLPSQGIRWLFLFALFIDLFLVVVMTPLSRERTSPTWTSSNGTPEPTRRKQAVEKGKGGGAGSEILAGKGKEKKTSGNSTAGEKKQGASKSDDPTSKQNGDSRKPDQEGSQTSESRQNDSGASDGPRGEAKLFGEKKRHKHRRRPESVRRKARKGPLRDGFVRIFDAERNGTGGSDSKTSKEKGNDGSENSEKEKRRKARSTYKKYRRRAEKMMRKRPFSSEERDLIRRYFEAIRPE